MTRVELRWLPDWSAYSVRVGAQVIGLVRCGERLPFTPNCHVVYA